MTRFYFTTCDRLILPLAAKLLDCACGPAAAPDEDGPRYPMPHR